MDDTLVEVYTCSGGLEAQTFRIFLEAHGLRVMVSQESAGAVHGLTVGTLGMARIYVRAEQAEEARALLRAMELGAFEADAPKADLWVGKRRWKKKRSKRNLG